MHHNHEVPIYDVAIVGGGIAGMYCSLKLAQQHRQIALFERSNRCGGRIETVLMGKGQEFKAEFGPMRYEEKRQKSLKKLLDELQLEYAPFPPYQSSQPKWPDYNIQDPEEQRWQDNPLNLLQMGVLKILGMYREGMSKAEMNEAVAKFERQEPATAPEYDFDILRRTARQGGKSNGELLYTRGFWNALSDVLSHRAVLKIRDLGNFYHLIAENPNAIEWIIFWLNGFQPNDRLVGIKGGSAQLTKELLKQLHQFENFTLANDQELRGLRSEGEMVRLYFQGEVEEVLAKRVILALPKQPLLRLSPYIPEIIQKALDTVIEIPLLKLFFVTDAPWWDEDTPPQTGAYTLPTREMHYYQEHCLQCSQARQAEYQVALNQQRIPTAMRDEFLDAGIDLPLDMTVELKDNGTGWILYYTPARKIHEYFIRREDMSVFNKNGKGMVMIYTDRPASEYWKDYILDPHTHECAEIRGDLRLVERFFKYLAYSFEIEQQNVENSTSQILPNWQRFQTQSTQKIVEELKGTIEDFGIHDWGKAPYHGACHVWRPNAKSWEVIARLKAFSLIHDPEKHKNIHICGEAYSDHQGFIEGALRSAQCVLDWIEAHEQGESRFEPPISLNELQ